MRLWHKDLIDVLPQKQLCGQWRECLAIARRIKENGTPAHILVNRIMEYPHCHFDSYCNAIWVEMVWRDYKPSEDKLTAVDEFCSCHLCKYDNDVEGCDRYGGSDLFCNWHNDTYLRECLYNLEEKYLCGGIPQAQWDKVYDKFSNRFDLAKER